MRHALALVVALVLQGAPLDAAIGEEWPAVARPRFTVDGQTLGSGTAFFLGAEDTDAGAVAVAAAHSFQPEELARAEEVVFQLGRTGRRVGFSSRFHAAPGRPFSDPGATLRDDFMIFALDAPPSGVRLLRLDPRPAELKRQRVQILGVPSAIAQDEDDLFGTVRSATPTRIEVDLDVPADLRGWGGAPVLRYPEGTVVGILQAAWPDADTLRLGVAPVAGVREALARPLDGGLGRPFAAYRPSPPASEPAPQADPSERGPAPARGRAEDAEREDGSDERPFALSARPRSAAAAEGEPLLGRAGPLSTRIVLEIEHPADEAIVGDPNGAFVSGRAMALVGEFRRFDVMLVLDTSGSTNQMTGADVNGNGIVGEGGLKGIFGKSDPGDSVLAAEVAAARRILEGLDARNTRVGLVTFAGAPEAPRGTLVIGGSRRRRAALTEQPLTTDYARVERALDHVLERGAEGLTHMAEGLRTAIVELKGFRGGLSTPDPEAEQVVLFFTDGQPTLPYDPMFEADNVKAVLRSADLAERAGIRVHAFAIGPEALEGPVAVVEMAARTDGIFTPVRHPGDLVDVIENVSFANIEALELRNLSIEESATELTTRADGSFAALVPLHTGNNRVEVLARASDGSEARQEVNIRYAPDAPRIDLPRELMAQRNRLLEQRLVTLRRGRVAAEREQIERARKELLLEIERERTEARARAERQRKELELEVLEQPGGEGAADERAEPLGAEDEG